MGRTLKRVPISFDWPENQPWKGFINPYRSTDCPDCTPRDYAPGYNDQAAEVYAGAYSHLESETWPRGESWRYNLTQEEINLLHEKGRIHNLDEPPEAEEYNKRSKRKKIRPGGLDAIDVSIIVEHRTDGTTKCERCGGSAQVWYSEDIKQKYNNWERKEPPKGEGWQVWETVSEGSPITPVFETPEKLVNYLYLELEWSQEAAENFLYEDQNAPSMIADENGIQKGHEAIADKGDNK